MPGSTPVNPSRGVNRAIARNDGTSNQKLDWLLSIFEKEKEENNKLWCSRGTKQSSQDKVCNDTSDNGTSKIRIPPALSVSCCPVVYFT